MSTHCQGRGPVSELCDAPDDKDVLSESRCDRGRKVELNIARSRRTRGYGSGG
jgi:hypothetical protein